MSFWDKAKRPLFKAKVPNLSSYIGKTVVIPDVRYYQGERFVFSETPVKIETIVGNIGKTLGTDNPKPQYYEINGKHLISMLRFHAQMTGDKSITEKQFQDFEAIEFHAEKLPEDKSQTKDIQ